MNISATSTSTMAVASQSNKSTLIHQQADLTMSLPTPPLQKTKPQFWPHSPTSNATTSTASTTKTTLTDKLLNNAPLTLDDLEQFVLDSTMSTKPTESSVSSLDMDDFTLYAYDYEPIPSLTHLFPPL